MFWAKTAQSHPRLLQNFAPRKSALQARLVHLLEQVDQQRDPRAWGADLVEEPQSTPQPRRGVVAQWWEAAMLRLAALADWYDGMFRPAHHQRFLDLNREMALADRDLPSQRSEERRVGKEGRSRWAPYH